MARHNRKLSFTTPIIIGFAGILFSFLLIAVFATTTQRNDFLEDYHHINRNFTHNMATNYTDDGIKRGVRMGFTFRYASFVSQSQLSVSRSA